MIQVEEDFEEDDQLNYDTDIEIITTPEFWRDKPFHGSRDLLADEATNIDTEVVATPESWWDKSINESTRADEGMAVNSVSILVRTKSPAYEDFSISHFDSDKKVPGHEDREDGKGQF